jgi:hypothetical protein
MHNVYAFGSGGKIHIKPENKGKFTAYANSQGESVQQAASSVLSNPNASETLRKRAQFAKNAASWRRDDGGVITDPTDPKKTVVAVEQGDPSFTDEKQFNNFYRTKAVKYFQQADPDFYNKYQETLVSNGPVAADALIAYRGGLPKYVGAPKMKDVAYSNYAPDRTNLKDYIKRIGEESSKVREYNQNLKAEETQRRMKQNKNDVAITTN